MIDYKLQIGGVDYTQYMPYCFSDKEALDESLDMSHLELLYTSLSEPIKPLTEVVLTLTQGANTKTINRYVAIDQMTEVIGHNFTNHDLLLIETTKITERMFVGGKTVTQPLYNEFEPASVYAKISMSHNGVDETRYSYISAYTTPHQIGEFTLMSVNDFVQQEFSQLGTPSQGNIYLYQNGNVIQSTLNQTQTLTYTFADDIYEVNYLFNYTALDDVTVISVRFSINFMDLTQPDIVVKTITSEVDKLLLTTECLTETETPRFVFGDADLYNDIKSPEFTFAKMSLWEALSQVASYVQAIPYIDGKNEYGQQIIRFYKIDTNKQVSQVLLPYVSQTKTHDIEQFCSSLDTNIDNLLNSENINEINQNSRDTLTEPFEDGYQTLRTESGTVVITEDNCFIETKYPIGRIVKVECGYLRKADNEDQVLVGDITPYVYESTEYGALSSFEDDYPYAKSYALKWTYGQRNITGLNFKVENAVNPVFSYYSIVNIIVRKLGMNYSWWDNLWGTIRLPHLQFRVTYLPLVDTRVKQSKQYTEDANNFSLAYNQTANIVDSKAIGENLKGAIARFGNVDISKTYIIKNLNEIPNIGDRFDDNYYISTISTEYYRHFVICELGLAKNFNRYSQYVGVKNQLRFYEVSERQAMDRYIIREDYCTISEQIKTKTGNLPLSLALSNYIDNTANGDGKVTSADIIAYKGANALKEVLLSVIGLGIGNSTLLSFKFEDNYSAGNKAKTNDNIYNGVSGNPIKTQEFVKYGDTFGNVDYMAVDFIKGSPTQGTTYNYTKALEIGDNLPLLTPAYMGSKTSAVATRNNDRIQVWKDNREVIHFSYQIHYVTDNKQYVVGSGLGKYNGLVKDNLDMANDFKLVILANKLDGLSSIIDANEILAEQTFSVGVQDTETLTFTSNDTWAENGKAWAFIYEDENGVNTLIFGKNCDIVKNEIANVQTYLNFTHKIKEN